MTSEHTYKVIELVGSSPEGVQQAIENAISRASETLKHLDWFEVREIRGNINEGNIGWYQVKLGVGFRVLDPAELGRD
jgi:flavin-binding protein dodecin